MTWNCPKGYRSSAVKSTCVWGNWIPESIHCIGEFKTYQIMGLPGVWCPVLWPLLYLQHLGFSPTRLSPLSFCTEISACAVVQRCPGPCPAARLPPLGNTGAKGSRVSGSGACRGAGGAHGVGHRASWEWQSKDRGAWGRSLTARGSWVLVLLRREGWAIFNPGDGCCCPSPAKRGCFGGRGQGSSSWSRKGSGVVGPGAEGCCHKELLHHRVGRLEGCKGGAHVMTLVKVLSCHSNVCAGGYPMGLVGALMLWGIRGEGAWAERGEEMAGDEGHSPSRGWTSSPLKGEGLALSCAVGTALAGVGRIIRELCC